MESKTYPDRDFRLLASLFLFSGCQESLVREALEHPLCKRMCFEKGAVIYSKDSFFRSIGLVLSGKAKALKHSADGTEVVMQLFEPGTAFGAAALFHEEERYSSTILAVQKTEVLFLPQELLTQLFARERRVALNYIVYLSGRIAYLNRRIDSFTAGNAADKLATYLLELSRSSQDPAVILLPCSLSQLAERLNLGRASLYRALEELENRGALKRQGKTILLLNMALLQAES